MKNKYATIIGVVFLGMCFCVASWACSGNRDLASAGGEYVTMKRDINPVTSLKTMSSIDIVYYQRGGASSVEIHAPEEVAGHVVVDDRGGVLRVYYENGLRRHINKANVVVTVYSPSINTVTTQGSGNITLPKGVRTSGTLVMKTTGSGDISCGDVQCGEWISSTLGSGDVDVASVKCKKANLSIKASGDCKIGSLKCSEELVASVNASGDLSIGGGTASSAIYKVNASGDLDVKRLKATTVTATCNASGNIHLYASKSLTATVWGSGSIYYGGNPDKVQLKGPRISKFALARHAWDEPMRLIDEAARRDTTIHLLGAVIGRPVGW